MSRLSWFPFYVDDYLGGTTMFTAEDVGKYLLCLLAQWNSAERRAIPADADTLRTLCRGEGPSRMVLEKFQPLEIDGHKYLRNTRLSNEWLKARTEYEGKSRGGKHPRDLVSDIPGNRHTTTIDNHKVQETTHKQKRSTPPALGTDPKQTWVTPYADAWKERWGQESKVPLGQIIGEFRQGDLSLGQSEMLSRWKRYLAAAKDVKAARPRWFVEGLGQWKSAESPKPVMPHYLTPEGQREERIARITRGLAVDPPATPQEISTLRPKGDA